MEHGGSKLSFVPIEILRLTERGGVCVYVCVCVCVRVCVCVCVLLERRPVGPS